MYSISVLQMLSMLFPAKERPYKCQVPGCKSAYSHSKHLRAHETKKHGRIPKWKYSIPRSHGRSGSGYVSPNETFGDSSLDAPTGESEEAAASGEGFQPETEEDVKNDFNIEDSGGTERPVFPDFETE